MRYSPGDYDRISQQIKERVRIPMVWERLYGSVPLRWNSCHCPWREDKHSSFAVSPNGKVWYDRGTKDSGDVFNFYERAVGCDNSRAFKDLLAMAGGEEAIGTTPKVKVGPVAVQEPKRQFHPKLRVPLADELTAISVLRSISVEGLRIAVFRGLLWMADLKGHQCFVVTDKSRKCYIAKKITGDRWEDDAKAHLLAGSKAKWAIGIREAEKYPAICLCEGAPDFLAAFGHMFASGVEAEVAPVCLSSGISILDEALPDFTGKRVRIFAHNDVAGHTALEHWKAQLDRIAAPVDTFDFTGLVQADGSPVADLNDLCRIDVDSWEENQERVEAVMTF
jgi:hypothetical protein